AKPTQVGLVTDVGGLNDKSFNQAANTGRLNAEKDFGLKTSVIESKKQEDYVPNLTTFAQQNYDLVIAVGFLMQNAAWKVAKQFPNVKFAIIDGAPANDAGNTENLPNVANLFFKEQEAGYLVGVIAATMAKNMVGKATHNTVCSMGGIPIPPVDDTSNAVKSGSFKAGDNFFSATNDGIAFGKLDPVVPADAKAAADKALADIKSGAIKPKTDLTVK